MKHKFLQWIFQFIIIIIHFLRLLFPNTFQNLIQSIHYYANFLEFTFQINQSKKKIEFYLNPNK